MFGFRGHFVRRFFRRIMTPMSVENAQSKKNILAKAYFCISLATLCTVMYQVKQGRLNWLEAEGLIPEDETKLSPGFQYARMLGTKKATIIRVQGTELLGSKDYDIETFDINQHIEEEESSNTDSKNKFLKI